MTNQCRICKIQFKTEVASISICESCLEQIKSMLKTDKQFLADFLSLDKEFRSSLIKNLLQDNETKFQFLEGILDEKVLEKIAKAIFSLKAKPIGLEGSGSIADFFR